MFERFTEGARRAIFFARYEASSYGSPFIETEHLLLGLLREQRGLVTWFGGQSNAAAEIRTEIEKRIVPRERISTSVEVPLTQECKKALILAAESADRLSHQHIEPEHLLIGILRIESSVAAQILLAQGIKLQAVLEKASKSPRAKYPSAGRFFETPSASTILESFLAGLKSLNSEDLISFFAKDAQFIDASGKVWNGDEMRKAFEALFAPYGKKNAIHTVESTLADTGELFVAIVRWNNALVASEQRAWMHRMTLVLVPEADSWAVLSVQVTPVDFSAFRQTTGD
jgi:ketosteroid isomerase-like protein